MILKDAINLVADRLVISRHTVYLYIRKSNKSKSNELCSRREKSRLWKTRGFSCLSICPSFTQKGHAISQIFFFQDGVSNGNGLVYPANDEFNLTQAWQVFSTQHHIPLHLCVAASQRRGVVDVLAAKETDKTNLAEGLRLQA